MAKSPKQNTSKYEIAKEWTTGLIAGLTPQAIDRTDSPHHKAGYEAGYKLRFMKHALLNEYLRSIGVEQMGYVRLAGTPPASNPETEWVAEKRTEPVAEVEKQFGLPPGSLKANAAEQKDYLDGDGTL